MISIIYVYYNSSDVIFNSIDSVISSSKTTSYEIIIVVNKCTDIEIDEIEKYSNKIKIIELKKNIGFGSANNTGVKEARGEYVLVLNPDTLLTEHILDDMIDVMNNSPEIGASICKLYDENNIVQETVIRKKISFAFFVIQLYFLYKFPIVKSRFRKKYYYTSNELNEEQYPDSISGAFMLIRKDVFNRINGFDENYFMYVEDIDLSMRLKKISKLYYFPNRYVYHLGDKTLGLEFLEDKIRMNYSSLLYFIKTHYGKRRMFIFKILLFINGLLFFPLFSFFKNEKTKITIQKRSKLFLKIFSKKFFYE